MVCNISGLVCVDYTPLGKRQGIHGGGLTEPGHALWAVERMWLAENGLEDWYFTENSSHYPVQTKQVEPLQCTEDSWREVGHHLPHKAWLPHASPKNFHIWVFFGEMGVGGPCHS